MWPQPSHGVHDLNNFQSASFKDAITGVTAFLDYWYFKIFKYVFSLNNLMENFEQILTDRIFFIKRFFFSFNLYTYISIQIFDPTLEFYLNTRDNELKTWIYTTWACFHISNSISGYLDFGRKIFLSIFLFHSSPPPQL